MSCLVAKLHVMFTMNGTSKPKVTPINVAAGLPAAAGLLGAE
jgi:hypothetical protein